MSSGLYSHTTRATGTVLTSAVYNSDHQNHITNANPTMEGGYSDNVGQMQTVIDPGGAGSEILASSLATELAQLRFAIKRITGGAQWYTAPVTDLATIGGGAPLHLAFAGVLPLTLRRTENDTTPRGIISLQSGSGAGAKYSLQVVGNGSNAVAQINELIASTEISHTTPTLKTSAIKRHFNDGWSAGAAEVQTIAVDKAGFQDFNKIAAPANPAANRIRAYCKDVGGLSRLAYLDSAGTEQILTTALTPGVDDVRLGSVASTSMVTDNGDITFSASSGGVLTGLRGITTDPNGMVGVRFILHRPLQKLVSGSWTTVGQI